MENITIYADYMSQPSRAVLSLCKLLKIPFTLKEIRVFRGETLTEDYSKISPTQSVPTLVQGSLTLYESNAIMAYLSSLSPLGSTFYPSDPQTRALINNYLHWHHLNIRFSCGVFLFNRYGAKKIYGKSSEDIEELTLHARNEAFRILEEILSKSPYIAGTQTVTIADLVAFCEIVALKWADFNFAAYPSLNKWLNTVGNIEEVKETHKTFYKLLPRVKL